MEERLIRAGRLGVAAVLVALLVAAAARTAPAPLPKRRVTPPPTMPTLAVMRWNGLAWRTFFYPDGQYSAQTLTSNYAYVGTWRIEKANAGYVLVIRECLAREAAPYYCTYRIPLSADGRRGTGDWNHWRID